VTHYETSQVTSISLQEAAHSTAKPASRAKANHPIAAPCKDQVCVMWSFYQPFVVPAHGLKTQRGQGCIGERPHVQRRDRFQIFSASLV
jgi:hypothetical protein